MKSLLITATCALLLAPLGVRAQDEKPGAKPPAQEQPKGDELKRPKPKKPAEGDGESEEAKILERLTKNTKTAEQKLGDADTGDDTRKLQRDILKDIDELLKKAQNPPQDSNDQESSSSSSSSSDQKASQGSSAQQKPSQGSSAQQKPSSGSKMSQQARREQREKKRQQQQANAGGQKPMGGNQKPMGKEPKPGDKDPMANAGGGSGDKDNKNPMGGMPNGKPPRDLDPRLAEMYKDVWGHLPEKMRLEMDSYFKEKFMPRYNDLLKQYYSTIAEQNKKK